MITQIKSLFAVSVMVALLIVGCGGEEVPSCGEARTHARDIGCLLPSEEGAFLDVCIELIATVPNDCIEAVDDWLICIVETGSISSVECENLCSREFDEIIRCL